MKAKQWSDLSYIRNPSEINEWLLEGDPAIKYQVHRDLLDPDQETLEKYREEIETAGWGARLLAEKNEDGHWGRGFYQPKWTSTHYTLLDLKNLGISPDISQIHQAISKILTEEKGSDGGVNPARTVENSDVCVNGMFLNYASYFSSEEAELKSIVDFIISQRMKDGGFNCKSNTSGATHSSLHTTISILEGIREYYVNGYCYRINELIECGFTSREFILQHELFKSDHTGKTIDPKFLMLSFPSRWRYDILRSLDYFRFAKIDYDERIEPAIKVLLKKQRKDGRWPLQERHPGKTHFEMEKPGKPSRWNTLRALRVLNYFERKFISKV